MRRLAVLLAALVAALAAMAPAPAPAAAHVCSTTYEADFDPTPDDVDGDCVRNAADNCTSIPNADQVNSDNDAPGDACDDDDDNDGVLDNAPDNCRTVPNADQKRTQHPVYGDECLFDTDGDGAIDAEDNCRRSSNPGQENNDGDAVGDICDTDDDNDGWLDSEDNCARLFNKDQADADRDAVGNACDPDYTGESFVAPPVAPTDVAKQADRTPAHVTLKLASVQRASDARGGMAASVRCSEACSVSAQITLSKAVARKLKLKALVASGEAALEGSGGTYVFFTFNRTALKRLFKGPKVTATLTLKVLDGAGNATALSRSLRLAK